MKTNFINSVFTSITILLIAGCASMTQAPSAPPSATVSIREWSAAYYGSATAGKGTLNYNGQRHRFTISGVGVGGAGGQKISATGKVYNLNNLSSFAGTYHGVSLSASSGSCTTSRILARTKSAAVLFEPSFSNRSEKEAMKP